MSFYRSYEEFLNTEVFSATPGYIEIKDRHELYKRVNVDQSVLKNIFQTGINISYKECGESSTLAGYFSIKSKFKVIAILLLFPKEGLENQFRSCIQYLEKMAELGAKWVGESIEKEQWKSEYEVTRVEITKIFSAVTEPLCLVNRNGVIQEINDQLSVMVGNRRTTLIGEEISQILTPTSWEIIKQQRRKGEANLQFKQNQGYEILTMIQPIHLENEIESFLLFIPTKSGAKNEQKHRKLHRFEEIKGVSEALQMSISTAKRVSKGEATIMLRGESGTGKELFAQSIHNESDRMDNPFIAINCAAIPENLLESELFGYEKGAFTGADKDKPGRFELANKGTIFLDEIGDMSLYLQAKLLRVIQEKTIERIGSNKSKDIDVRIITATHQDLENLVREGKFREDLYYRISVIPIHIPPLRKRKEDLPILIEHYMSEFSKEMKRSPKKLSEEVLNRLVQYHWPGNIRELQNVVRHFVELEIGDTVTLHSLPSSFSKNGGELPLKEKVTTPRKPGKFDKTEILQQLDRYGWDTEGKKKVASALGISLATLYRRMKKLKI